VNPVQTISQLHCAYRDWLPIVIANVDCRKWEKHPSSMRGGGPRPCYRQEQRDEKPQTSFLHDGLIGVAPPFLDADFGEWFEGLSYPFKPID